MYNYNINTILEEPTKYWKHDYNFKAYKKLHANITKSGQCPKLQKLDNEASTILHDKMDTLGVNWKLVLPHIRQRNTDEISILT